MTYSGLQERDMLLGDTTKANLENLIEELQFLLSVSQKELNGEEYHR